MYVVVVVDTQVSKWKKSINSDRLPKRWIHTRTHEYVHTYMNRSFEYFAFGGRQESVPHTYASVYKRGATAAHTCRLLLFSLT